VVINYMIFPHFGFT